MILYSVLGKDLEFLCGRKEDKTNGRFLDCFSKDEWATGSRGSNWCH